MCISLWHVSKGRTSKKPRRDDGSLHLPAGSRAEELVNCPESYSSQTSYQMQRSRVSRRIPQGDFMAVTGTDGRRLYMTVKSESLIKHQVRLDVTVSHYCVCRAQPHLIFTWCGSFFACCTLGVIRSFQIVYWILFQLLCCLQMQLE